MSAASTIQPASEPPSPLVPREFRLRLDPLLLLATLGIVACSLIAIKGATADDVTGLDDGLDGERRGGRRVGQRAAGVRGRRRLVVAAAGGGEEGDEGRRDGDDPPWSRGPGHGS